MELFSQSFIRHVKHILDTKGLTVIATIPVPKGRPLQLVEEVRARPDAQVFTVSFNFEALFFTLCKLNIGISFLG